MGLLVGLEEGLAVEGFEEGFRVSPACVGSLVVGLRVGEEDGEKVNIEGM